MVFTHEDGEGADLFLPDPFLRANPNNQAGDLLIEATEDLLPSHLKTHWIDDWEWYHLALGEVHCGSNTKRAPSADWWAEGLEFPSE